MRPNHTAASWQRGSRGDVVDCVLHGPNPVDITLRNLEPEFRFEGDHQFNCVQAVRTEIIDQGCRGIDDLRCNTEMAGNDLRDPRSNIDHVLPVMLCHDDWSKAAFRRGLLTPVAPKLLPAECYIRPSPGSILEAD